MGQEVWYNFLVRIGSTNAETWSAKSLYELSTSYTIRYTGRWLRMQHRGRWRKPLRWRSRRPFWEPTIRRSFPSDGHRSTATPMQRGGLADFRAWLFLLRSLCRQAHGVGLLRGVPRIRGHGIHVFSRLVHPIANTARLQHHAMPRLPPA
jgi:hypothetical protein